MMILSPHERLYSILHTWKNPAFVPTPSLSKKKMSMSYRAADASNCLLSFHTTLSAAGNLKQWTGETWWKWSVSALVKSMEYLRLSLISQGGRAKKA